MSDYIIKVENLGKKYRIRHEQRECYTALGDILALGARGIGYSVLDLARTHHAFRRTARGFIHFNPPNRAKSLSVVCNTNPRSIASAAKCASVVKLPAVPAFCSNDLNRGK